MKTKIILLSVLSLLLLESTRGQNNKLRFSLSTNNIVAGYVDKGAFLNFTGPSIKLENEASELLVGLLPSLRFKEDNAAIKNAFVTTSLGVGITYTYKIYILQLPVYYNSKTTTADGKWNLGVGIGINLNRIIRKNKFYLSLNNHEKRN